MTRLDELLRNAAGVHGTRVAVEEPGVETITYEALDTEADVLSEKLRNAGVRPGDRVGICAHKSIDVVVAIFAILRSQAAYVPVDPSAPTERNAYIFTDCATAALLVEKPMVEGLRRAFGDIELTTVDSYRDKLALIRRPTNVATDGAPAEGGGQSEDALAYILYTSGSTGRPKGVMISHRNAISFIDWCSATFTPHADDRFSSHAPFHFDLSILDLYVPLRHGARVVLISEVLAKQPAALAALIAERRLTHWYSTPSVLTLLLHYGQLDRHDCSALRTVCFAGEVFPIEHLRSLSKIWPHPRYFNLYGPTETNVCTFFELPPRIPDGQTEPFPIGCVCSHCRAKVMDVDDREVPKGGQGELYIAGPSVMPGYWNLPDRTAKAYFVDEVGTRWYRTGDVVQQADDQTYTFIGRRDRMVKRRGYRVELGEIEAALHRHPDIVEAAVVALSDGAQGVRIQAFVSCIAGKRFSQIEMKQFAFSHLPVYMIPDGFSFIESLPKSSTDKIDYQRLMELS